MPRFGTIPPLTRTLIITLTSLTILNAIIQPEYTAWSTPFTKKGNGLPYLAIIPGKSYKYPWTFLLASFVEQNVFGLAVTGATLFFGGRYLERAWSSAEFGKFLVIVALVPNVLCWGLYLFLFGISGSGKARNTTISGGISIQAAFLVAFKQLIPEHTVSVWRLLRMRVKHFPALFLLLNTISGTLLGTETAMFLSLFAFLTSWAYLRFYRTSTILSSTSTSTDNLPTARGDASDTFGFAFFFPEPIHTPIALVADKCYELAIAFGVCSPFSTEDVESGNVQASARAEGGLPTIMGGRGSGRREEAERRRALALQALDQRLHTATTRGTSGGAAVNVPAPVATQQSSDVNGSERPQEGGSQ
ncbi:DUF1751-domain-containing protein [Tothia fuscella]|uniref:DUF1751-domain-containing protein n=1 Tax=Tothia fuscella TaxID=1048955 RepID=A0A9P4NMV8_9PEZI|nr:DUF1751-domain-containing protein [Tothia fuscella]